MSLPNLRAGRMVVPEFYRRATTPAQLADVTLNLLDDEVALAAQRQAFTEIADQLGEGNVAARAASLVLAVTTRVR
jgi:lipid A disaccharide synthetase